MPLAPAPSPVGLWCPRRAALTSAGPAPVTGGAPAGGGRGGRHLGATVTVGESVVDHARPTVQRLKLMRRGGVRLGGDSWHAGGGWYRSTLW